MTAAHGRNVSKRTVWPSTIAAEACIHAVGGERAARTNDWFGAQVGRELVGQAFSKADALTPTSIGHTVVLYLTETPF